MPSPSARGMRSEEHTSELQSLAYLVCRLLLEKKKGAFEDPLRSLSLLTGEPLLRDSGYSNLQQEPRAMHDQCLQNNRPSCKHACSAFCFIYQRSVPRIIGPISTGDNNSWIPQDLHPRLVCKLFTSVFRPRSCHPFEKTYPPQITSTSVFFFFLWTRPPPKSTLFPYTPLSR